ncbi:MAG: DNA-processing protein DprA [Cyanobacteria bacterium P01_G01_bin.38]
MAWSSLDGIGPILQKRIFDAFGSLETAWNAPLEDLARVNGIGLPLAEKIGMLRSRCAPDTMLAEYEDRSQAFWTPADDDYPALLFAIPDPPPVLYYRGARYQGAQKTKALLSDALTIGMVGTRRPSSYGVRWTRRLSQRLTQQGSIIVSGLADGVDTLAHQSCLKEQGTTIAVLGTGVDVVYPAFNQALYDQVVETGLVLSEYPDGTPPDRGHFPRRNRIIAGLSRAILVTEAPERSGALITAYLANDYGREVYALPGSLDNASSRGCLKLINQGGQMILDEYHLLESLGRLPVVTATGATSPASQTEQLTLDAAPVAVPLPPPKLPPDWQVVFEAISDEPLTLDNLVQRTHLETGKLLGTLVQLELQGLVIQLPGMRYQRQN